VAFGGGGRGDVEGGGGSELGDSGGGCCLEVKITSAKFTGARLNELAEKCDFPWPIHRIPGGSRRHLQLVCQSGYINKWPFGYGLSRDCSLNFPQLKLVFCEQFAAAAADDRYN